jgi:hypothetical protein
LKQLVSNLTQELLPLSKIERDSIFKLEQVVVSDLVQELLVVSKIETSIFEPTAAQELVAISKSSGTISGFEVSVRM